MIATFKVKCVGISATVMLPGRGALSSYNGHLRDPGLAAVANIHTAQNGSRAIRRIRMRRVGKWFGGVAVTGISVLGLALASGSALASILFCTLAALIWLVFFADISCSA